MCDEAVDDCLAALKFLTDRFVASKLFVKFHHTLLANDDILFLMEILIKSHFLLIKWIFLMKLILMMIIVSMKMILKLIFTSDFWLDAAS